MERMCLKIGGGFQGIFTNNSLHVKNEGYYIVNTISDAKIMGHWVMFYFDANGEVLFIDSFAKHPSMYGGNIFKFYTDLNVKIVVKSQLQSNDSLVCGLYCLHFLFYLKEKYSMRRILSHFSDNYRKNDRIVERILAKIGVDRCVLSFCPSLMYNRKCMAMCTCVHTCNK